REFIGSFGFPMLRAHAIYENDYLLGTAIARPIIAAHQVEVAHETGADAVAHGATSKGNDQVRFELTYGAIDQKLTIIAPWKDPNFELRDRESAIDYANRKGVPVEQSKKKIYSRDRNLWHISHEGADLESPANEPKDELWVMSVPVSRAPDEPEYVSIDFEAGNPVADRPALRGAGLLRAVVPPPPRGPAGVHRPHAGIGNGPGPGQAFQGPRDRRRRQQPAFAVRPAARQLQHGGLRRDCGARVHR